MQENIYADAINAALGTSSAPVTPTKGKFEPAKLYNERVKARPVADQQGDMGYMGRIHHDHYRSFSFTVREFGSVSYSRMPNDDYDYWTVFYSDEDFALIFKTDDPGFEERIAACKRAIDNAVEGRVMWTQAWYLRHRSV